MNEELHVETRTCQRDTEIAATLEEYRALRAEVTPTVERQYAVTYWGISAIAVLIAAMINSFQQLWNAPFLSLLLFYIVVPGLCSAFVLTWSHIIIKLVKLGAHLYVVEEKICVLIKGQEFDRDRPDLMPMCWEHFVNEPGSYGYRKTLHAVVCSIAAAVAVSQSVAIVLTVRFFRRGLLPLTGRHLAIAVFVVIGTCWLVCAWLFRWIAKQTDLSMSHRNSFAGSVRKITTT